MGHVRDAMRRFDAEKPAEPVLPQEPQPHRETATSAVLRAVQQVERKRAESRPPGIGSGDRPHRHPVEQVRPVAAAVMAGAEAAATAVVAPPAAPVRTQFSETAIVQREKGSAISEQYRIMRSNLLARFDDGRVCVMVTSAEAGEGKSVTTVNLALALAELQEGRTIVIDCDLRKGRVARLAGVRQTPGVVEILNQGVTLREAVQPTGVANLDVLPAGRLCPDEVGELLGRPELAELICNLRRQYEFILIDTPPVNRVSDVGMIGRCVSDALMVVRMNHTSRDAVTRAMRLLRAVNINIAGLALTHQKYFIPGYLYKYS